MREYVERDACFRQRSKKQVGRCERHVGGVVCGARKLCRCCLSHNIHYRTCLKLRRCASRQSKTKNASTCVVLVYVAIGYHVVTSRCEDASAESAAVFGYVRKWVRAKEVNVATTSSLERLDVIRQLVLSLTL